MSDFKFGCLAFLVLWLLCLAGSYFLGGLIVWAIWKYVVMALWTGAPALSYWVCGLIALILGQIFGARPRASFS